jgi:ATP-dependent helicase/DNAse subunit B
VRFLLGPAGSGKTFRCLAEIRAALAESPDGPPSLRFGAASPPVLCGGAASPPLILIAPKQATFQLERQLLDGETISGFTRLEVLSFDRLAEFIFENLHVAPPSLLSAEGRLMVLRALVRQHDAELKLLRGSARRAGFAQEIGGQLAELQQHQFSPTRLRALAANESLRPELRDKLHDLALLLEKYADWLKQHDLQDVNCLLDFATARLRSEPDPPNSPFVIQHLWMDGFAEMTPQEQALLSAIVPFCQKATLAFCLETEPTPAASWLSIWSAIGKTFQRCRLQLAALPGCQVRTEILGRTPGKNRFAENSALAMLEAGWALPVAGGFEGADLKAQVSVTACADPEAEAVFAARKLLKFVRAGNRFRECAVLVRNLESYHQPLARVFRRYEIPFFLDRRESVAHHPLAELTRSALRTVAGDWRHDDWFAALKAGFTPLPEGDIDRLENAALESGWRGKKWREPLPEEDCERLRQRIFPPFEHFYRQLKRQKLQPTGAQLAEAIRELWDDLEVEATLEKWSSPETGDLSGITRHATLHQTVFEQMTNWLDNVAMAFPREPLPLGDWLPVLEAGLAGLTVGVIPPALDEVLVGAIDRARNPDLKFTLLLGVNESVFPAAPAAPVILTNSDRDELDRQNATLGLDMLNQISRERYLGYIACTRANQKLAVTFARQDADGRTLNPSPLVAQLQKNFPALEIGEFSGGADWREAEHAVELVPRIVGPQHELEDTGRPPSLERGGKSDVGGTTHLTPGRTSAWHHSPPSDGAEREKRSQRPGEIGRLVGSGVQGANYGGSSHPGPPHEPEDELELEGSAPSLDRGGKSDVGETTHLTMNRGDKLELEGRPPSPRPSPPGEGETLPASRRNRTLGRFRGEGNSPMLTQLLEIPALRLLAEKLAELREPDERENLSPALAEKIYGAVLRSSVSRLEEFAQCPFRFFVHSGLRAEERKKFELDARERGSFQHEILKKFHEDLTAENKRWRDVTPAEARERIGQIAAGLAPDYREGLLRADDESRFTARALTAALQDFVATLVAWMRGQYEFDPAKAETGFGLDDPGLPDWKIELGDGHTLALRGRVDRIDVCRDGDRALAVVMDYKSGIRKLDKILIEHGVQLQLLAYLAAVRRWPAEFFGAEKIVPAGVFYVNLRGQFEQGSSRTEVLAAADAAQRLAYRHTGRFDAALLEKLDRGHARDQFNYQLNKDGSLRSNSAEALSCKEFTALLDQVEEQLRTLGQRIFSGAAEVDPYRKGTATACDFCDYQAVCRIDGWTHEWRMLRAKD